MMLTNGLLEEYMVDAKPVEPVVETDVANQEAVTMLIEGLQDAVFKMRAFTESRDGDLGFGVELGMQRAADMIENVINRHLSKEV